MQPNYPLYIPSKGRWDSRLTARVLDTMRVPYHVIVEEQEYDAYAAVIDSNRLLVLDPAYQRDYETCDDLGASKSKGPGPARNFAWDHAKVHGYPWHWVMDDNIRVFYRLNRNAKLRMLDGACFRLMEEFVERYENVAMAGPAYQYFVPERHRLAPFILNTRIYSCNLIRNDVPFRWRGRYNEDTILSLDMLKAGWCTIQFQAFLQDKITTQALAGGNTEEFYRREGTRPKSEMLVRVHPDVCRLMWRYHRVHHYADYSRFRANRLRRKPGHNLAATPNEHGLRLVERTPRGKLPSGERRFNATVSTVSTVESAHGTSEEP